MDPTQTERRLGTQERHWRNVLRLRQLPLRDSRNLWTQQRQASCNPHRSTTDSEDIGIHVHRQVQGVRCEDRMERSSLGLNVLQRPDSLFLPFPPMVLCPTVSMDSPTILAPTYVLTRLTGSIFPPALICTCGNGQMWDRVCLFIWVPDFLWLAQHLVNFQRLPQHGPVSRLLHLCVTFVIDISHVLESVHICMFYKR